MKWALLAALVAGVAVFQWGKVVGGTTAKVDCAESKVIEVKQRENKRFEDLKKVRKIRTKLVQDEAYRDSVRTFFSGV